MFRVEDPPDGRPMPSSGSLCAAFVDDLGVDGASISVVSYGGRQSTVCSSDTTMARAEALQFELGEGPHWDALSSRAPVIATDLNAATEHRWPMLVDGIRGLGIQSIFAFPMLMGAALVGVVDLYSLTPRSVDNEFIAKASLHAGRVAMGAVQRALHSATDSESEESPMAPALRREVHQATGMIIAQLNISATAAFARLQGHAFVTSQPIDDIAHEVVTGRLDFANLPDDHYTPEGG
ncbi:GAF and ANTAR domain-containing protein [Demequina sp.]|uniref:GAF and ANTAR domain-containing protein n=1 Tax=Demequina sp. TaxID=2050685 RepID=UPI0025C6B9A9|nr:GAF and ANTAR domain-containing protein [Demequina sp.]